ncbi:phenylacetate--CoA ligase family protein [Blastochloris tepida]|uniref:Phenylacetate--CoA ligase n=1 Tax=Blastochloris tepida TaxID=2233851 RepID=A0A348G2C0_9HYPH|nr:AMP-binding protein [Blastochloris tepida]BBF93703.1 phenylacetate--CoA ligase [Blastochloris tepida]
MSEAEHFDALETRSPEAREADLAARLPAVIAKAMTAPGWARHLDGIDPHAVTSRAALAKLPVLYKSSLPERQAAEPPFGGLVAERLAAFGRLFASPGPIFEPEPAHADPWNVARSLYAAGFRPGDVVLNTFSYHLTPGGLMLDQAARALGCPVIPAGPGNTEQQLQVMAAFRPVAYCGTPDFLKILLDAAAAKGVAPSLTKAVVSGAAFPPSLQAEVAGRGIAAYQLYASADLGCIAYETPARAGMVVNEDVVLEIVRPGTGEPVADGEVGEVLVTSLDIHRPLIRFSLGDLSAILPGTSPCGRTNRRIKGWMGRAEQSTKVKGMFVTPAQIAEVARRHRDIGRLQLVVARAGEQDVMTLKAEAAAGDAALAEALGATLAAVTKLKGAVELVAPGTLANDGKVILDTRPVAS